MLGFSNVAVHKKPRVALFSSGDELIDIGAPLTAGKIHDSNSYVMKALLQNAGVDVVALESTGVYWIPVYEVLEQRGLKSGPAGRTWRR